MFISPEFSLSLCPFTRLLSCISCVPFIKRLFILTSRLLHPSHYTAVTDEQTWLQEDDCSWGCAVGIGVTPQYELERSSRACSATAPPSVRAAQAPPSVHAAQAPPSVHAAWEPPSVRAARVPPSVRTARAPSSARSSQVRSSACSSQVHSNAHSSREPTRAPPSGHPPEPTPPEGPPDVVDFHNNFFLGGLYVHGHSG